VTSLRERLAASSCLVGTIVSSDSTVIAEVVALSGIDWVFFDLEHSASSLETVQRQLQALGGRVLSMIRVQAPEAISVAKALDTGCNGVIVPQVNSAAIALAVVDAGKYPPLGHRSIGAGRAHAYGAQSAEYLATANRDTSVILQIESVAAVDAIDEIVAVPGVDGLFIGPNDLSASLGLVGQMRHPTVLAAIDRVRVAATRAGLPLGIYVGTDAAALDMANDYQLLLIGSDVARLRRSLEDTVRARQLAVSPERSAM
jgi:2-dehydro-3-deoxyglucarate aldolase